MSQSTNEIGNAGESLASTHLKNMGFKIRERNWRHRRDEIDIIAENQDFIIFVEVKTRKNNSFGRPEDFVTLKKQRFMTRAANEYIVNQELQKEARFDIIAITDLEGAKELEHIEDAFYAIL